MWQHNSLSVLQLSQMMYGCGAIIGALLAKPFFYGDLSNKTDDPQQYYQTLRLSRTPPLHNTTVIEEDINYSVDRRSRLIIPSFIGGGLTLVSKMLAIKY